MLCDAEVLHNRSGIEGHLNQKHKYLTIKSYYSWYIQHILNPSPNEPKNIEKTDEDSEPKVAESKASTAVSEDKTEGATLVKESANTWAEKCEYKCQVDGCEDSSYSASCALTAHLAKAHKIHSMKEYTNKYGSAITNRMHHKCVLCNTELVHTRSGIEGHLQRKHHVDISPTIFWFTERMSLW